MNFVIILGVSKDLRKLQDALQRLLAYGLITVKTKTKKKLVPSLKFWLTELTDTLHSEIIRFILKDKLKDFEKVWQPLVSRLEGQTMEIGYTGYIILTALLGKEGRRDGVLQYG